MSLIGTPLSSSATKVMLLGSGELGKEVVIELQRLGCEVIAVDRYANAPAMQVAHRSHVISMLDGDALRRLIEVEKPDYIVPEIEAIATDTLVELESEGYTVVPTARAAKLTMNREGIRRLAAEELGLKTSPYVFASTEEEFRAAIAKIGMPCVVKPIMSSSGKGQSVVKTEADIAHSWQYAQEGGRAGKGKVIVEGFVDFDYEITMLTVRHIGGTAFCAPVGHTQIKGDEVIFSEVSPRPHDTGLVTLISQDLSEFALHVRGILGLPIPNIHQNGPSASCAVLVEGESSTVQFGKLNEVLAEPDTQVRLFGKPTVSGQRRMAVTLARAEDIDQARAKAHRAAQAMEIRL